jgi:hypothetical protein
MYIFRGSCRVSENSWLGIFTGISARTMPDYFTCNIRRL